MFFFEELDETTRGLMLAEFEADLAAGKLTVNDGLTETGRSKYPDLLRQAIAEGDSDKFGESLRHREYWKSDAQHIWKEGEGPNPLAHGRVEVYAESQFNLYYMRALCRKLLSENVTHAVVYQAKSVENAGVFGNVAPGDLVPCTIVLEELRSPPSLPAVVGIPIDAASGISLRRKRGFARTR